MALQINPKLLEEWKKVGEILIVWRCNRCFKKIPFYKTDNDLINSIHLSFAQFEKHCLKCKEKLNPTRVLKETGRREILLLKKYENVIVEEDYEYL